MSNKLGQFVKNFREKILRNFYLQREENIFLNYTYTGMLYLFRKIHECFLINANN